MAGPGSPPEYKLDRDGSLAPRWYEFRYWSKKKWIMIGVAFVLILVIVIAASVVATRRGGSYPDYTRLNYRLAETYSGQDFFQNFNYFTGFDPTQGFVHYVPEPQAQQLNLTYASPSSAILRVDTSVTPESEPNASTGRFSVRITSKNTYGLNNLFIFDVKHMPVGCGTWPALWLSDPDNWPDNGEIDVIEQVNAVSPDAYNQMTLHTTPNCDMDTERKQSGKTLSTSCVNSTNDNEGCAVDAGAGTYGSQFNANGGGILAVELRSAGIRMWQWVRGEVPTDISAGNPDPSAWGEASADFPNTNCNIENHFRNQSIIANINLCGVWAGAEGVYGESCSGLCTDLVANNATAFEDAFWEFGEFNIYTVA